MLRLWAGDTIFISYSGHGSNIVDNNGDERDERDEVLFTGDLKIISDDELNTIFKQVKSGVNVYCVFDCCNSGSIIDLKTR